MPRIETKTILNGKLLAFIRGTISKKEKIFDCYPMYFLYTDDSPLENTLPNQQKKLKDH